MAVKKTLWLLLANVVYLSTIVALSDATSLPRGQSNPPPTEFEDHTIRMDGAISSRLPDENGEYVFVLNTETNFTCIPSTKVEPRQSMVYISLQNNRGRHLDGCDCTLQLNIHSEDFQCFCSIPWTFRRTGKQDIMCCIDDSYSDDCLNGYSFHIHVIEMSSTTEGPTTAGTSHVPSLEVDNSSTMTQSRHTSSMVHRTSTHMGETSQGSSENSTSIPNFQLSPGDSDSRKTGSGYSTVRGFILCLGVAAVVVAGVIAAIVLYKLKRASSAPAVPPPPTDV